MRAARLLHILLILQNRGRQTAPALAEELEVSPRTILRDADAMTEAGLPILVFQGFGGGIELGFNYRTRLTGMAEDEAEALAVMLYRSVPELGPLGLEKAGDRARSKLVESFPDKVRATMARAREMFTHEADTAAQVDPRVEAVARAMRARTWVTLRAHAPDALKVAPQRLWFDGRDWWVQGQGKPEPLSNWGDINISARRFDTSGPDNR